MDEKLLGRGLKALRRSRGLALQDVALRSGLPVGEIVRYEQGGAGWKVERLLLVLDSLGADLGELEAAAASGETLTVQQRLQRAAVELARLAEETSKLDLVQETGGHRSSRGS